MAPLGRATSNSLWVPSIQPRAGHSTLVTRGRWLIGRAGSQLVEGCEGGPRTVPGSWFHPGLPVPPQGMAPRGIFSEKGGGRPVSEPWRWWQLGRPVEASAGSQGSPSCPPQAGLPPSRPCRPIWVAPCLPPVLALLAPQEALQSGPWPCHPKGARGRTSLLLFSRGTWGLSLGGTGVLTVSPAPDAAGPSPAPSSAPALLPSEPGLWLHPSSGLQPFALLPSVSWRVARCLPL